MTKKRTNKNIINHGRHNWSDYMDGLQHRLKKGKDFNNAKSMRCSVHAAASRKGMRALTKLKSNGDLMIQFLPTT